MKFEKSENDIWLKTRFLEIIFALRLRYGSYGRGSAYAPSGPTLQLRLTDLLDGTAEHTKAQEAAPEIRRDPAPVR